SRRGVQESRHIGHAASLTRTAGRGMEKSHPNGALTGHRPLTVLQQDAQPHREGTRLQKRFRRAAANGRPLGRGVRRKYRDVERDQAGNFLGSVNQRKREFGPKILGSEANLEGSSRTPSALSQTRESG